jgi:glycosyltransferase involved in cell wall biosynthesis
MRIAVNARLLTHTRKEGLGVYAHEVISRLVQQHPEDEFLFLFDRPYPASSIYGPNVTPLVYGPPARHPFLYYIWFHLRLPRVLKKHKADVFFSPDGYLALGADIPQVPVFHDLNFEHFPGLFSPIERWFYHTFFPKYAHTAKRIVAISNFTRQDLVATYGVPSDHIDTVYNGLGLDVMPASDKSQEAFREKHALKAPYFAFVGGLYPRKNLINMVKAFDVFKTQTGLPHEFVIAGSRYRESEPLFEAVKGLNHATSIRFLGRLPERSEVNALLSGATALMYVSLFEGFGLPLIEAMQCGTPVITGKGSAMPEIAGEAALYAEASDVADIARSMEHMATHEEVRQALIAKGKSRVQMFQWEKTAQLVYESLKKAVKD